MKWLLIILMLCFYGTGYANVLVEEFNGKTYQHEIKSVGFKEGVGEYTLWNKFWLVTMAGAKAMEIVATEDALNRG